VREGRFFGRNFDTFLAQIEPNPAEDVHVHIGHPKQREFGNQVAAPVWEQQLIPGNDQENCGNVVAEAVFTSKKIEEFSLVDTLADFTLADTKIAKFAYDLCMGNGPGH
jgi:hypothetical protein